MKTAEQKLLHHIENYIGCLFHKKPKKKIKKLRSKLLKIIKKNYEKRVGI